MKKAVVSASSNGAFKYLPAQLDYEILWRSRPPTFKRRLFSYKYVLAVLVTGLSVAFYLASSGLNVGFVAYSIVFVATAYVMSKFWGSAAAVGRRPKHPKDALRRYEAVNAAPGKIALGSKKLDLGGKGAMFDRLLVCEHAAYREFYIANDFHLHHACHVLGPGDLETKDGRRLLDELKKKPDLDVFVVHDATPHGARFADAVRTDQHWFAGSDPEKVLDLGLLSDQLSLFAPMLRPLKRKELEDVEPSETGALATMGADLSTIPAGPLLMLTGASVDERLPFEKNSYTEHKSKKTSANRDVDEWWLYIGGDGE